MKKCLSLLLVFLLLLSICGCNPSTNAVTEPQLQTEPVTSVQTFTVPDLTGQLVDELAESEEYSVQVSHEMSVAGYADGQIVSQAPVEGSEAEQGATIYVIVNVGDNISETTAAPETTQSTPTYPQIDYPHYPDYPDYPEQTDPDIPLQESQPEQTDPPQTLPPQTDPPETEPQYSLDRNGSYTTKNDVALYIHLYGRLPNNFITKNQAEDRYGWDGGSLSRYGMCIGGDRFYNNEGRLPGGQTYYECDIDTLYSSKRGSKRLVFTYSGIIYYTSDHYRTFTRLY